MEEITIGETKEVNINGQVFAMYEEGKPVLLAIPQLGPTLALFKTVEDLEYYMNLAHVTGYKIKKVDNGPQFLKSGFPYYVVCNMRFDPVTKKSKWQLILPEECS